MDKWDKAHLQAAETYAQLSSARRMKVGCVIVKDNRIISQGYNGYLPGYPHESIMENGHEIGTIHAEQNAIVDCAKRGVSCDGATIYITHYPCFNCMKFICASGIKKIFYLNNYNNDPNVIKLVNDNICIKRCVVKDKRV